MSKMIKALSIILTMVAMGWLLDVSGYVNWATLGNALLSPFTLLTNENFMLPMTFLSIPILIPTFFIGLYYLIKAIIKLIVMIIEKIMEPKVVVDELDEKQKLMNHLSGGK